MKLAVQDDRRRWLDDHAARWAEAGIVSPEQAQAIVRAEGGGGPPTEPDRQRLSIGSEAAAYAGSALALIGGAFLVVQSWESMPAAARILVGVVVGVVGLVAGRMLHAMSERGAERLAGFLWLVAVGGVALTTGVSVHAAGVDTPELIAMAIGAVVLAVGFVLWRNLERPLQLLTTVAGAMVLAISSASYVDLRPWIAGIALWVAAFAAGALAARGRLRPQLLTLMLAALGLLAVSALLSDLSERAVAPVGMVTAAGIVLAALALHRTPVLVIGVLGTLVFLQGLFALYFSGPLASAVVALLGIGVVIVVIVVGEGPRIDRGRVGAAALGSGRRQPTQDPRRGAAGVPAASSGR